MRPLPRILTLLVVLTLFLAGQVSAGTSHEEFLLGLGIEDLELHHVDFLLDFFVAISEGRADITAVSAIAAHDTLAEYPELGERLTILREFPQAIHAGFAVSPGSDLLPALDRHLEKARQSGELARIVAKHQAEKLNPNAAG